MYVSDLALNDFRSYGELVLALEPGPTAFVGHNGQGKTNLVEAVGYLSTFASHRVASDAALVRHGATAAVVRAKVVRGDRPTLVELEIIAGRANRARVNRAPVRRTRDALGLVSCVIFAPEDLGLVKGDPQDRRRFLDDLLVLRSPRLAGVRGEYDKVLRQRGALLKSAGATRGRVSASTLGTLDVWDGHLAAAGAQLVAARVALVRALRPLVARTYEEVSAGQGHAHVAYRSSLLVEEDAATAEDPALEEGLLEPGAVRDRLVEAMGRVRGKEIDRGVSLVGPHRDDLVLTLGELPAKGYASHGESWSYALALRLASYELLRDDGAEGADPVLILDDVFAELDVRRRERLAEMVAGAQQVLVTAAVPEDVPAALTGARFDVHAGAVTRA
jgi:DNA replication and repair protein RecF